MSLGNIIKKLREEKNLTQLELSSILKIEQSTLANYENNRRIPKPEILISIADYFNVTTDYLMGRSNVQRPIKEELSIPDEFHNGLFAFHKGDVEDLTQDEVNKIAEYIKFVKAQRK